MPRPRQVSDEKILETARRVFLEHGPGVATSVIAKLVGFSEAALFRRFRTKHELLIRALCGTEELQWSALLERGPDTREPREQLLEIALTVHRLLERLVPAAWTLRASGLDPGKVLESFDVPPPVRVHQLLTDWLRRLDEQGRARVAHPEAFALALLGAVHTNVFFRHVIGGAVFPMDHEVYLRGVIDTYWSGIAPPHPEETAA